MQKPEGDQHQIEDFDDRAINGLYVSRNGWRQGSVLPVNLVAELLDCHQLPEVIIPRSETTSGVLKSIRNGFWRAFRRTGLAKNFDPSNDIWIVISQDCDLVQYDWDKEPFVELVRVLKVSDSEGEGMWLTSPRTYVFSDPPDEKPSHRFKCIVHDRVRIDRRYLAYFSPDPHRSFAAENIRRLIHWIARRYVRAAFPDEFNNRIQSSLQKLARKKSSSLVKYSDLLTGIYLYVPEGELEPEEVYEIVLWGVVRPNVIKDQVLASHAQELVDELEALFFECDGIDVSASYLKSEQDVTLDHLHKWKRWDFDSLSLKPKQKGKPVPPIDEIPKEY